MRGRCGGIAAVLLAMGGGAGEPPAEEPPEAAVAAPAPIHQAGSAHERALLDTIAGFLRDDAAAALAAMQRVDDGCRKLSRSEDAAIHPDVILYDQALHTALDRSRSLARRGSLTDAFDQFVWVQRACRQCHEMARRHGLIPPERGSAGPPSPSSR